jgi:para-nitrobenzyl esterase
MKQFARAGLVGAVAVYLSAAVTTAGAALEEPVKLDAGLLGASVESSPGVRVFKGIPFAAPPVGELRWKAPQPVAKWSGVRDASKFGDVCIQPAGPTAGPNARLNIALMDGSPPASEDCLYLNVWTPAASASDKLPVMVYWFGGAFTEGSGSVPLYDGDALARKGAIVVTMNYRLGPYGFFAHPALTAESPHKASGNYGLMDMLASARWVQSNIAAFGGDPDNVTVFGQSAGAMAIASLVASPEAKGLFRRAIGQSVMGGGVSPGMATLAQAMEQGEKAATAAGAATAAELRAMSPAVVTEKLRSAGMIVDGYVIPEDPAITYAAGRQNAVDVLFGANKDESFFAAQTTPQQFEEQARGRFAAVADRYLAAYPHATAEQAGVATAETFRDQAFWNARRYADYQRKRGNDAYVFFFTQNPPAPAGQAPLPATHASEVPYVFNNLGKLPLFPDRSDPKLAAASSADRAVAEQMSSYWVNFARSGDPNGRGLPKWPEYRSLERVDAAILDAAPASESLPSLERLAVFDALLERQLSGK